MVIWEPDVELQPLQGRGVEGEYGRVAFGIEQLQTLAFRLRHLHTNCVISDKFPNLSELSSQ